MVFAQKPVNLGLGCVTFGREIDQLSSFDLLDFAYGNGIKLFDTAAAYGNGTSENILGDWLLSREIDRSKIMVDTKILPPFYENGIKCTVERSLMRLKVDYIDTLYLHRWDESINIKSLLALTEFVKAGFIKNIGISNVSSAHLNNLLVLGAETGCAKSISVVQNNHNLAVSDLNDALIKLCKHKISIVTFSPLGAGFLTGKHQKGTVKNSRFDIVPAHQAIYFNPKAEERLLRLLTVAKKHNKSPEFLALAWAIHQPQTSTVLIGGRTAAQLDVAFKAAKFYDEVLFEKLNSITIQDH